jgi:hypothetical protein
MGATQGHLVIAGVQGVWQTTRDTIHGIRMAGAVKLRAAAVARHLPPLITEFHIFKILSFTMIMIPLDWILRD